MAAVQLVRPVCGDDEQPVPPRVPDQEPEQVARGAVNPVDILDDQDDEAMPSQSGQNAVDSLEQLLPASSAGVAESRPQCCQRRTQRRLEP